MEAVDFGFPITRSFSPVRTHPLQSAVNFFSVSPCLRGGFGFRRAMRFMVLNPLGRRPMRHSTIGPPLVTAWILWALGRGKGC